MRADVEPGPIAVSPYLLKQSGSGRARVDAGGGQRRGAPRRPGSVVPSRNSRTQGGRAARRRAWPAARARTRPGPTPGVRRRRAASITPGVVPGGGQIPARSSTTPGSVSGRSDTRGVWQTERSPPSRLRRERQVRQRRQQGLDLVLQIGGPLGRPLPGALVLRHGQPPVLDLLLDDRAGSPRRSGSVWRPRLRPPRQRLRPRAHRRRAARPRRRCRRPRRCRWPRARSAVPRPPPGRAASSPRSTSSGGRRARRPPGRRRLRAGRIGRAGRAGMARRRP